MPDTPDRIRCRCEVTAMVALDTIRLLADRVHNLLTSGRRMTIVRRYPDSDATPTVTVGLVYGHTEGWERDGGIGYHYRLQPGLTSSGFGFSARKGEADVERVVRTRYHTQGSNRYNMTEVGIVGGLPGNGPAADDRLVIRRWNDHARCEETVVAFDYGPDPERIARHLYLRDHASDDTAATRWDTGQVPAGQVAEYAQAADEILAVVAGKEG